MKTFKIKTFGCKVNQYEGQFLRETLLKNGMEDITGTTGLPPDIYIVNTCTVTKKADIEAVHFFKKILEDNKNTGKFILTGCLVEKDRDFLEEKFKDFLSDKVVIVNNSDKEKIVDMIFDAKPLRISGISNFYGHEKAFVKIQDGCSNFCSYCKVPLVRHKLSCRRPDDILEEISCLVQNGFEEIILTGVCLGSWNHDDLSFSNLLTLITDRIKGNFRIRISSIEPYYINSNIIDLINKNKKICSHFHIPLQSGDDKILHLMNRHYTFAGFLNITKQIHKKVKSASITTDVIVGFPGEQEKHFLNTLKAIQKIKPLRVHIFSYSRRKGTEAFKLGNTVSEKEKKGRVARLTEVVEKASFEYRKNFPNKNLNVLIEKFPDKATGMVRGYSENYINVLVRNLPDSSRLMGKIISCKIVEISEKHTIGEALL